PERVFTPAFASSERCADVASRTDLVGRPGGRARDRRPRRPSVLKPIRFEEGATIMRRLMVFLVLLAGLCFGARAEAALKVVTSTPDLASIAREVGGANIEITSLALATQDPHFVDAKPHLALKLANADLLIALGLDLEVGWLPTLQ